MTKTHLPGRHFPFPATLGAGPTARDRHVVVLLGPKCRGSTDDTEQPRWMRPNFLKITLFFWLAGCLKGIHKCAKHLVTYRENWETGDDTQVRTNLYIGYIISIHYIFTYTIYTYIHILCDDISSLISEARYMIAMILYTIF